MKFNNKQNRIKVVLRDYVVWRDFYKEWMIRYEHPFAYTKSDYLNFAIEAAAHASKARKELEELLGFEINF